MLPKALLTGLVTAVTVLGQDSNNVPTNVILKPAVHWSRDTAKVENIIPTPAADACPMYYGDPNPMNEGYYGWLTYHFSYPAVNIDECDHATAQHKEDSSSLHVQFSNHEAFDLASKHWDTTGGLVLVANIDSCGQDHDRCFFNATNVDIQSGELAIIASGTPQNPHDIIEKASTKFGWWVPGRTRGVQTQTGGSNGGYYAGIPVSLDPHPAHDPRSPSPALAGILGRFSNADSTSTTGPSPAVTSSTFGDSRSCTPPADDVNGLPTACLGDYFDLDLDDQQGYYSIANNSEFENFVRHLTPETSYGDSDTAFAQDCCSFNKIFKVFQAALPAFTPIAQTIVQKVKAATSISGSINKSFFFKLPDPSNSNITAKTPNDTTLKQTNSPWGGAILIKAFGDAQKFDAADKASYLNVFCVNCGAQSTVSFSGQATWAAGGLSFTEGYIEVNADIKIILQLGIDAKIKYSERLNNSIFDYGLPGLEFGIVNVGPRVTVGSSITFEAAADGKMLAGAEMGIKNGKARLDWVNNRNSLEGWEPYVNPVFQAEGSIMVSAALGLPVGIAFGVKIKGFNKDVSVSIIDTPSIRATAQIAGSIGLGDNGFSGGLKSANNCSGISTALTWRNSVDVGIFGKNINLYDTSDKPLAQNCINLNGSSQSTNSMSEIGMGTTSRSPAGGSVGEIAARRSNSAGRDLIVRRALTGINRFVVRQNNTSTNGTDNVEDLTSKVKGNETFSYELGEVKPSGYTQLDQYSFSMMKDSNLDTKLVSCSNGNLYLAGVDATNLTYCSELFSSYQELLVLDDTRRYMYYYNNTMEKVGVSRLRVADADKVPKEAILVVMVPYQRPTGNSTEGEIVDPDEDDYSSYNYYAMDIYENVLFPAVCTYADGSLPRVFLVKDFNEGPRNLTADALQNTVTGGKVDNCFSMGFVLERFTEDNDYVSFDESEDIPLEYDE